MSKQTKITSNPFSSGGGGTNFELKVQTSFALLMLTGGLVPCLPIRSIHKIKLQGHFNGYNTDDMIVYTANPNNSNPCKLLAQIKHRFSFTAGSEECKDVLAGAWNDFQDKNIFTQDNDAIAIITGPLSKTDINSIRPTLERARATENASEFFLQMNLAKFTSETARTKLKIIRDHIDNANGTHVSDDEIWFFLRHLHLLGYDLDIKSGVIQVLFHSMIRLHTDENAAGVWGQVLQEVMNANQNAGTLSRSNFPSDLLSLFEKPSIQKIPESLARNIAPTSSAIGHSILPEHFDATTLATILGAWSDRKSGDKAAIEQLAKAFDENH